MTGYFNKHMVDAIRINRSRRPAYVAQAGNTARLLSHWMVGMERLFIPVTLYFDKKAAPFIEAGIPIVKNDFIDMEYIEDPSKPPQYTGISTPAVFQRLNTALKDLKKEGALALKKDDYMAICEHTAEVLSLINKLEDESQAHLAMSKHMLESIGYAALHAPIYLEQSQGQTEKLGKQLVGLQVWLADAGVGTDKLAQRCHKMGAGILVNDVPYIPFLDEFKEVKA